MQKSLSNMVLFGMFLMAVQMLVLCTVLKLDATTAMLTLLLSSGVEGLFALGAAWLARRRLAEDSSSTDEQ